VWKKLPVKAVSTSSKLRESLLACGLALLAAAESACQRQRTSSSSGIVLVAFEGLRADRFADPVLSPASSPNLLRLARDGTELTQAWTSTPWSPASFAALITGRGPWRRQMNNLGQTLQPSERTLAEALLGQGWRTALISNDARLSAARGVDQGYQVARQFEAGGSSAQQVAQEAQRFLEQCAAEGCSYFLTLVFSDPLPPWPTPEEAGRRPPAGTGVEGGESLEYLASMGQDLSPPERSGLAQLHDAGVARADRALGMVLDTLDHFHLDRSTLVVATSLGGVSLGESAWVGEAGSLSEATVRVPLIAAGPWIPRQRKLEGALSTLGVAPTLLEYAGVAGGLEPGDATSFLDALRGSSAQAAAPVRLELEYEPRLPMPEERSVRARAWIEGGWKLALPAVGAPFQLFDLAADPTEARDLAARQSGLVTSLSSKLERAREATRAGAALLPAGLRPLPSQER
jgi:arylsulfatase A-like enzyme